MSITWSMLIVIFLIHIYLNHLDVSLTILTNVVAFLYNSKLSSGNQCWFSMCMLFANCRCLKLLYVLWLFIECMVCTYCSLVGFRCEISSVYCLPSCTKPYVSSSGQWPSEWCHIQHSSCCLWHYRSDFMILTHKRLWMYYLIHILHFFECEFIFMMFWVGSYLEHVFIFLKLLNDANVMLLNIIMFIARYGYIVILCGWLQLTNYGSMPIRLEPFLSAYIF